MIIFSIALLNLFRKRKILLLFIVLFYSFISVLTYHYFKRYYNIIDFWFIDKYIKYSILGLIYLLIICVAIETIMLCGLPFSRFKIENQLKGVKYLKDDKFRPTLIDITKKGNGEMLSFYSRIPKETFEDKTSETETALNKKIFDYKCEGSPRITTICVGDLEKFRKKNMVYNDSMCDKNSAEFVLGESCFEKISIDISKTPHILLGGGSGSGKGNLIRCMIRQSLLKGFDIYILDVSGATDYYMFDNGKVNFAKDLDSIENALKELQEIRNERQKIFDETKTVDIIDYNNKNSNKMNMIFIAIDEYAQLMTFKAFSKEIAEKVKLIENIIMDLACNSRKAGFCLCVALQRAEANTINGTIKENLINKIVGRCDSYSSAMVIGDDKACKLINSNDIGMFYHKDKGLFKAYYYDFNSM